MSEIDAGPAQLPAPAALAASTAAWRAYGRSLDDIQRRSREITSLSRQVSGAFDASTRSLVRNGQQVAGTGSSWERMKVILRDAAGAWDRDAIRFSMSAADSMDRASERMERSLARGFQRVLQAGRAVFQQFGRPGWAGGDLGTGGLTGGGLPGIAIPNLALPMPSAQTGGGGGGFGGLIDASSAVIGGLRQVVPYLGSFGQAIGQVLPGLGAVASIAGFINRPSLSSGLSAAGGLMSAGSAMGLLPATLGPVGAIVSAVGMVVSMFGSRQRHPGAGVDLDFTGSGFTTGKVTAKHMDPTPMVEFVRTAADALNRVPEILGGRWSADPRTATLAMGVGNGGRISVHGFGAVVEHEKPEDALNDLFYRAIRNVRMEGISASMQTVLRTSRATDLKGLLEDLDFARLYDSLGEAPRVIGPFEQQLAALNQRFDEIRERARSLELAIEPVDAARLVEQQKLRDRFNQEIGDQLLQRLNPTALALRQLGEEFDLLRQEAMALGANLDQVNQLERLQRQQIIQSAVDRILDAERQQQRDRLQIQLDGHRQQLQAEQRRVAQLERLVPSLKLAFDRLAVDQALSPLSHEDRLAEARRQFEEVATRAAGGDLDAAEDLEQAGRTLLEASRGFNASNQDYVRDYERVREVLANTRTVAELQLEEARRQTTLLETLITRIEGTIRGTTAMAPPPRAIGDAYLAANPDVAAAVASGLFTSAEQHYEMLGRAEGRAWSATQPINVATTDTFNDRQQAYLDANPDVAAAVAAGTISNAYSHYLQFGRGEGRTFARGGFLPAGEIGLAGETGRPELILGPAYVANPDVTRRVMGQGEAAPGHADAVVGRLDQLVAVSHEGARRIDQAITRLSGLIDDLRANTQRLAARS
ncbi:MAG: hypothetical protein SF002_16650 [Alphaproteobacteria bacterium]|nr:hypothetical protein [Alphaproteobacteria bacterium]